MSTLMTVLIIAAVVAVALAAGALLYRRTGSGGGTRSLRRRFGPEYERTLARHDGDEAAADRELRDRVERYGGLKPLPLEPKVREEYTAQWTTLQERFVDAPRQAVADADRLLARIAETRGFPGAESHEEQTAALSVHHPHHVDGFREARRAAHHEAASTEDLREAMLHARALFEDLTDGGAPVSPARQGQRVPKETALRRPNVLKPKGSGA
ncbi:hypothetical protein [Streptomyces genisteinicus]|uniref:Secreted protein n=1 Tax=Streptomyces genisteinicus TaxID=2768068 RepID=A0A7H0HRC1_9ACTN|nr:hypothetical protein [Streptomyces genisteinicus]QNP63087.1 hypothetical protein IAG43_09140 [Streptomyces genisteinicus]